MGTFRRCLPVWVFLIAHVLLFVGIGYIHPAGLVMIPLILVWVVVFLSGTGLYFGTCCQKTSSAVISNLALILILWLVVPAVVGVLCVFGRYEHLLNHVAFANPLVQAVEAMSGLAGTEHASQTWARIRFHMMAGGLERSRDFVRELGIYAVVYICTGIGFVVLARRRMRKRIF